MRAPRQGPQERMGGNTPTSPSSYPAFSYQGLPLDEPGWNEGQRGWSARAQTQAKIASPGLGGKRKITSTSAAPRALPRVGAS